MVLLSPLKTGAERAAVRESPAAGDAACASHKAYLVSTLHEVKALSV